MLHLLDESLETFLRAVVPLPKEIDVVFAAPDKDWAARVSRPTINLYLWDVRRNTSEREFGIFTETDDNGRTVHRAPQPRVDCRYLITAWTADSRDEHSLLGATLAAVLTQPVLEAEHVAPAYRTVEPRPSLTLATGDGSENSDFWSALGGQLKPGLDITVTATVDIGLMAEAGPAVQRIGIAATPTGGERSERLFVAGRTDAPPGTIVSTAHGAAEVGADGSFVVSAEVGDDLRVDGKRRHKVAGSGGSDV
jgi:hypothetical protein